MGSSPVAPVGRWRLRGYETPRDEVRLGNSRIDD
jgi:hypothetical protein